MTDRLTVVIPATDRRATLGGVLLAVASAQDPAEEVLVVDTDGAGPAAARNEGAERATGDILVFVDSDVEIHPDALSRIRRAFRDDPGLTAVFGSYDDSPAHTDVGSQFRNLLHHHVHQENAGPATTFWAGLGAIRRAAFLELGGFDSERYAAATMEDIELGMRITAAGGRIVLDPWLRGTHLKRWPVTSMVRTDFWKRGTPWVRLLLRRRELSSALNLSWHNRLSAMLSLYLAWAVGRLRVIPTAVAVAGFFGLNHRFHRLLWRRASMRTALAGLPLHVLHHLTAVASVAVGCLLELGGLFSSDRGSARPGRATPQARRDTRGERQGTRSGRPYAAARS